MKSIKNSVTLFAVLAALATSVSGVQAQTRGHSFNVFDIVITTTQVTFTGSPSAETSLNRPMEARVCNQGNTVTFTGQTHTFTSVDETFSYSVDISGGGFSNGDPVLISVTDIEESTDCNNGAEGVILELPVGFSSIARSVPALGFGGLTLLLVLLVGVAALQQRRLFPA